MAKARIDDTQSVVDQVKQEVPTSLIANFSAQGKLIREQANLLDKKLEDKYRSAVKDEWKSHSDTVLSLAEVQNRKGLIAYLNHSAETFDASVDDFIQKNRDALRTFNRLAAVINAFAPNSCAVWDKKALQKIKKIESHYSHQTLCLKVKKLHSPKTKKASSTISPLLLAIENAHFDVEGIEELRKFVLDLVNKGPLLKPINKHSYEFERFPIDLIGFVQ